MKKLFFLCSLVCCFKAQAQTYSDSIKNYQSNYVTNHRVVKDQDKTSIQFFEPDLNFRVVANVERKENAPWFSMPTSGKTVKIFRVFGVLTFSVHDTLVTLNIYQSQNMMNSPEYQEWLFLPFTDGTTGTETYDGGRYLDLKMNDIKNNQLLIDFNKAYNPYCVYVSNVYNCPIPPKENNLSVWIRAGEKMFRK